MQLSYPLVVSIVIEFECLKWKQQAPIVHFATAFLVLFCLSNTTISGSFVGYTILYWVHKLHICKVNYFVTYKGLNEYYEISIVPFYKIWLN